VREATDSWAILLILDDVLTLFPGSHCSWDGVSDRTIRPYEFLFFSQGTVIHTGRKNSDFPNVIIVLFKSGILIILKFLAILLVTIDVDMTVVPVE